MGEYHKVLNNSTKEETMKLYWKCPHCLHEHSVTMDTPDQELIEKLSVCRCGNKVEPYIDGKKVCGSREISTK
jgi:transcription elongation factor Elf1